MTPAPLTHIERCRDDALAFVAIAREGAPNALADASDLLFELGHMQFGYVHDTLKRARLYALRDEAVRDINRAIEDAE